METVRLRCRWETASRRPYFANLKVMRRVLNAVRAEVEAAGGAVPAYVFLEDLFAMVAEGPAPGLEAALDRAREESAADFAASDRKPLWGERRDETVTGRDEEEAVGPLLRLPVEAGLAAEPRDYPWLGGDWLLPPEGKAEGGATGFRNAGPGVGQPRR